jgi:lysyl-tRNA synthetase class 2
VASTVCSRSTATFATKGISVRHNPEFTMMEFYAAYWNYQDLMTFTEELVRDAARKAVGTCSSPMTAARSTWLLPFERLTILQAIEKYTDAGPQVQDSAWLIQAAAQAGQVRGTPQAGDPQRWPACR